MQFIVDRSINNSHALSNIIYYNKIKNDVDNNIFILFKEKNYCKLAKKIMIDDNDNDDKIYMNNMDRSLLNVTLGTKIDVEIIEKPPSAKRIIITPYDKTKNNIINNNNNEALEKNLQYLLNNTVVNKMSCIVASINNNIINYYIECIYDKNENEHQYAFVDSNTEIYLTNKNSIENNANENKNLNNIDNNINIIKNIDNINFNNKNVNFDNLENNNNNINIENIDFENIGVGGLSEQFKSLIKNIFLSRIIPTELYKKLGIKHTKGVILYGPPGCGKTRIAKQIANIVNCKNVRVINGPELFNKYVGESERLIRECFDEARNNSRELHILIFDEFDSIAGTRSDDDSTHKTKSSVVCQLLTMIDGYNELNNIIIFGLTNRLDMIDSAILRPGRLGIHLKIDLPDVVGRYEILKIHCSDIIKNNICEPNLDLYIVAEHTEFFTGAELESLVQMTIQMIIGENIDFNNITKSLKKIKSDEILITTQHFINNVANITPSNIVSKNNIVDNLKNKIVMKLDNKHHNLINEISNFIVSISYSQIICIKGNKKSGKTSIICQICTNLTNDYKIEYIDAQKLINFNKNEKIEYLKNVFIQTPDTIIVMDNIELIVEYISKFMFNVEIFNLIKILLTNLYCPIILTTSYYDILEEMTLFDNVDKVFEIL